MYISPYGRCLTNRPRLTKAQLPARRGQIADHAGLPVLRVPTLERDRCVGHVSTSFRSGNFASVAIASVKRISWRACVDALTYCTLAAKRELNLL